MSWERNVRSHRIKGKSEQSGWGSKWPQGSSNLELINCPSGTQPQRGLDSNLDPIRKAPDWLTLLNKPIPW